MIQKVNPFTRIIKLYSGTNFIKILFVVTCCCFVPLAQLKAGNDAPSTEEISKITQVVPAKPSVEPAKPRRLLVFSRSWGYKHSSIPYGKKAVEIMAQKTGAFEAVLSDDDAMFEPDNIKQFDAILFNNTNNEIFLPEDFDELSDAEQAKASKHDQFLKKSLVDFISEGKGLAVIHAGLASFRKWPEFGNIIGARFDNHPWESGSTVTLKVEEPGHPVVAAFKEPFFIVTDEIYQFTVPYSRSRLRVLLSVDAAKTSIILDRIGMVHRSDNDFAISWVKSYGKGRVFYCALGHDHEIFWNPVILQHYLDGIQFALGDLKANTTPSAMIKTVDISTK
jgi:type 1 glutamine amidotransferase